jgi:hypothetical protein
MSRTGDALEALYDVIKAKSEEPSPKLPAPHQNEALPARLLEVSGLEMHVNIWDDTDDEPEELLGADVVPDAYEFTKDVTVEFIVAGGERVARRIAFEAGLEAIDDAVAADRTLGGNVDDARLASVRRNGSGLVTDGMPNVLAANIRVRLSYTSSRPF